jgi:hypothetical protein
MACGGLVGGRGGVERTGTFSIVAPVLETVPIVPGHFLANSGRICLVALRGSERTARRPRRLDFERASSKMTSKIAPSEKFLPNLTESRHRIALSSLQNYYYEFPYTWIF